MGKVSRKEYLAAIRERYRTAERKEKGRILSEFCVNCGYNRKYAIRILSAKPKPAKKKSGPQPMYDAAVIRHLKALWLATDQMCSKKLVKAIELWMPYYGLECGGLEKAIKAKLLRLSAATIDRLLKPGFIEADTVAHCGNALEGDFAYSVTYTDINSTWTENRAVWGKGAAGVVEMTKEVEESLEFAIVAFWSDNGSEFLNHHFWRYFAERKKPVKFSRSRPYKKNDNAHVEQKNWTHVRQLFGYDRIDKAELIEGMNAIYRLWGQYQNHFSPSRKLAEKTKVNSKYIKKYDTPTTPYQRLLDSSHIADEAKEKLRAVHATLNPFHLKKEIEKKLGRFFNDLRLPVS